MATVASVDAGPPLKLGTGMARDSHLLADFGRENRPGGHREDRHALSRKIVVRLRRRANNVVDDAVHEFSLLLASRYNVVILPKPRFRVADKVGGGKLGSTVVRRIMMFSVPVGHGKFRSLLPVPVLAKAAMYSCALSDTPATSRRRGSPTALRFQRKHAAHHRCVARSWFAAVVLTVEFAL